MPTDVRTDFRGTSMAACPQSGFDSFVGALRAQRRLEAPEFDDRAVPCFDPGNGNEEARFLLVLEAPGPQAVKDSGKVSLNNHDKTARNLKAQLSEARVRDDEIAVWNIVPWYVGSPDYSKIEPPGGDDIDKGVAALVNLLPLMPRLQCIVLVGASARRAHVRLSYSSVCRILSCHHTSPRVMQPGSNQWKDNVKVFDCMRCNWPAPVAGA